MFSKVKYSKDKIEFIETAADTNGAYLTLLAEVYSGGGPPLHYHKILTQTFKVQEGVLYLKVDDKVHVLKAGDIYVVPPMVPHCESSEKGKLMRCLVEIRPGHAGYQNFMNMTYNRADSKISEAEKKKIYLSADTYMP